MGSTVVKNRNEIAEVRRLAEDGISQRAIAKQMGFSKNTVRKIVYRINGYEGDEFNRADRWAGGHYRTPKYVSQIDGEELHYQKPNSAACPRVSINGGRMWLHIYEAKKAYRILELEWPNQAIVHHRDYDRENLSPDNLVVFDSVGPHIRHHADLAKAMYNFLRQKGLFDEFYQDHPEVRCKTLGDMLRDIDWPFNFDPT